MLKKDDDVKLERCELYDSLAAFKAGMNKHPVPWYKKIYYRICRVISYIKEIPGEIGYFVQRGLMGWSHRDVWGMHSHLTNVILNMLVEFKTMKHGYPEKIGEKQWNAILDSMITGFTTLLKCDIGEDLEWGGWYTTKQERDKASKWAKKWNMRITTREEEREVKYAFDLLRDHWFNLWD